MRWLNRRGGQREGRAGAFSWGATYGRGRAAFSVFVNMHRLYSPEPWHRYRHLLPASLCQFTVYTQTSASLHTKKGDTQHLTGLHFAILPGPRSPVLYTKTLMHPVKPLAGDTISSQAPIKPSVSTCDKDDHLFS